MEPAELISEGINSGLLGVRGKGPEGHQIPHGLKGSIVTTVGLWLSLRQGFI